MFRSANTLQDYPVPKRPRLSAPAPDDGLQTTEGASFGRTPPHTNSSQPSSSAPGRDDARPPLRDDPDNPFSATPVSGFAPATKLAGFGSAASAFGSMQQSYGGEEYAPSSSPEVPPPEPDYDAWFAPATDMPPPAFQTARIASAPIGFMKASNKGRLEPSSEALAKAKAKIDAIWAVDQVGYSSSVVTESHVGVENSFTNASNVSRLLSPERPALRVLDNSFNSPGTPTPGESRALASFTSASTTSAFTSPLLSKFKGKTKPFKPPLLSKPGFASSPLVPRTGFATASSQHSFPTSSTILPQTPLRPAALASATPLSVPRSRARPPAFITPFKPGMKPGEPGRKQLEKRETPKIQSLTPSRPTRASYFDLSRPSERQTLLAYGLTPQAHTEEELDDMGIVVSEMKQITLATAPYYSFHAESSSALLGPTAALSELLSRGCSLATRSWVDNHWSLVLWKLAGMVGMDPERENSPNTKRWCWAEVMRQLLYRYERELNRGVRPALKCITARDSPASCPMVLCISDITWSQPSIAEDGSPIPAHPELELTDGWYRLRAQVDAPMARAARRGLLTIGRKLGIMGARLSNDRKDPSEVLEAYDSMRLELSGNSCHLVPWHTKMGFQNASWVSTMHSLSSDGGIVAGMDLVIVKTYPIAFLEFWEDENGEKHREGPWNQRDEDKAAEKWIRKREIQQARLQEELSKKESRYQGYAERLERRAGPHVPRPDSEDPPDDIDELYDELENPKDAANVIARTDGKVAGWLARSILERLDKDRERAAEEIERELKSICPPREVRNFRVLIVQDACTRRRQANRSAQLTVWDALDAKLDEGQRYAVTNLVPTSISAWMDRHEEQSEIYLGTRRDSKWKRL